MTTRPAPQQDDGFTTAEIVVVIAVIAVLGLIVVTTQLTLLRSGTEDVVDISLRTIETDAVTLAEAAGLADPAVFLDDVVARFQYTSTGDDNFVQANHTSDGNGTVRFQTLDSCRVLEVGTVRTPGTITSCDDNPVTWEIPTYDIPPPATPGGVTATDAVGGVLLRWNVPDPAVSTATTYRLTAGGTPVADVAPYAGQAFIPAEGLPAPTGTVTISVQAFNAEGDPSPGSAADTTTLSASPTGAIGTPAQVHATHNGTAVVVTWDPVPGATEYQVHVRNDGDATNSAAATTTLAAPAHTATLTGIGSGTAVIWVTAVVDDAADGTLGAGADAITTCRAPDSGGNRRCGGPAYVTVPVP